MAYGIPAGWPWAMSHAEVLEVVPINSVLRRPPHIIPLRSVVEIREAKSVEQLWLTGYGSKNSAISRPTWVYVDSFAALLLAERRDVVEARRPLPLRPSLDIGRKRAYVCRRSCPSLKLRTVRYALAKLREMGVVDVLVDPLNHGRRVYCAK